MKYAELKPPYPINRKFSLSIAYDYESRTMGQRQLSIVVKIKNR